MQHIFALGLTVSRAGSGTVFLFFSFWKLVEPSDDR